MTPKTATQQAEFEQAIIRDRDLDREVASQWATIPPPSHEREQEVLDLLDTSPHSR
jgi:hypothetical protein